MPMSLISVRNVRILKTMGCFVTPFIPHRTICLNLTSVAWEMKAKFLKSYYFLFESTVSLIYTNKTQNSKQNHSNSCIYSRANKTGAD